MIWTYVQRTGYWLTPDGKVVPGSYSGFGAGKNAPERQAVSNVGPIPAGRWLAGRPYASSTLGPLVFPLTPDAATRTFGRSAFRIHGDSVAAPGTASHGCIVSPRALRERLAPLAPFVFDVIAERPTT